MPRIRVGGFYNYVLPKSADMYVDDDLLQSYRSDVMWLHFVQEDASRIKPISEWTNEPIDIWGT